MFFLAGHDASRCSRFHFSQTRPKSNNYQTDYLDFGRVMELLSGHGLEQIVGVLWAGVGEREGLRPLASFSVGETTRVHHFTVFFRRSVLLALCPVFQRESVWDIGLEDAHQVSNCLPLQ